MQISIYSDLNDRSKLVREGPPPPSPEMDTASGEMWAQLAPSIANSERAGPAQQMVRIVSDLPEFPTFKKMLDLGGGPWLIGTAIVASHPNMSGVIFDQPDVVKVAQTFVKEYGMDDRIGVMSGDYTTDPIGEEYDLIWASTTLNFARDDMDSMIAKIYDALGPGGVFINCSEGLTNERTKPDSHVLSSMWLSLMGQDMCFDQGEITDSILRVVQVGSFTHTGNGLGSDGSRYRTEMTIEVSTKSEGKNDSHRDHRGLLLCVLSDLCGR